MNGRKHRGNVTLMKRRAVAMKRVAETPGASDELPAKKSKGSSKKFWKLRYNRKSESFTVSEYELSAVKAYPCCHECWFQIFLTTRLNVLPNVLILLCYTFHSEDSKREEMVTEMTEPAPWKKDFVSKNVDKAALMLNKKIIEGVPEGFFDDKKLNSRVSFWSSHVENQKDCFTTHTRDFLKMELLIELLKLYSFCSYAIKQLIEN